MQPDPTKRDVRAYWRNLVTGGDADDVDQVGHADMGSAFNREAYAVRLAAVVRALDKLGWRAAASRVFEAAYGVGFYLRHWDRSGCTRVVGAELSERAVESARRAFPAFDLRQGDLSFLDEWPDWPALVATFDLVTAIDVLYHIVDDDAAERALGLLASLVAPGGHLLVTEKFCDPLPRSAEVGIVVRRSRAWYADVVAAAGLEPAFELPMFWGMDPPVRYAGRSLSYLAATIPWRAARLATKFFRRNGAVQQVTGRIVGVAARRLDLAIVPRLRATPNLTVAVYRRPAR